MRGHGSSPMASQTSYPRLGYYLWHRESPFLAFRIIKFLKGLTFFLYVLDLNQNMSFEILNTGF
jgi:hypothetical protein